MAASTHLPCYQITSVSGVADGHTAQSNYYLSKIFYWREAIATKPLVGNSWLVRHTWMGCQCFNISYVCRPTNVKRPHKFTAVTNRKSHLFCLHKRPCWWPCVTFEGHSIQCLFSTCIILKPVTKSARFQSTWDRNLIQLGLQYHVKYFIYSI